MGVPALKTRRLEHVWVALVYIESAVILVAPLLRVKNNEHKWITGTNPSGTVQ